MNLPMAGQSHAHVVHEDCCFVLSRSPHKRDLAFMTIATTRTTITMRPEKVLASEAFPEKYGTTIETTATKRMKPRTPRAMVLVFKILA